MKDKKVFESTNKKKLQTGLSLIELLIAMFIGLFLLVGISSSYISSKKTSMKQSQYSMLEENGRLALEIIQRTIEHTGYTTALGNPLDNKFISSAVNSKVCNDTSASVLLDPNLFPNPATNDDDGSDSIGVVYLGDAKISMDCAGEVLIPSCQLPNVTNTEVARIYSAFFIDKTDVNEPKLQCAGSRSTSIQTIADGVENMQILYGVDVDGDNTVERYVSEPDVGTLWDNVISIQVGLLMRSSTEINDEATEKKFSLLDTKITTNDRYQRAVFNTTISLRNSFN